MTQSWWWALVAGAWLVDAVYGGGCVRIGEGGSLQLSGLTAQVPTSFVFELFFKLIGAPAPGQELLRLGTPSASVVLSTDAGPSWVVAYGARSNPALDDRETPSTRFVPAPHEWIYVVISYNATAKSIQSAMNDRILAQPLLAVSPALVVDQLTIGSSMPVLVDFARFSPLPAAGFVSRLFYNASFRPTPLPLYAPLFAFDAPSSLAPAAARGLAGAVALVPNCGARENYAFKVPPPAIVVDGDASECAWRDAPIDQYALYEWGPLVTQLRLLWDDANLYIFAEMDDATPSADLSNASDFRTDSMEVLFATTRNTFTATRRLLFVQDARYNDARVETAAKRSGRGWQIEVRIPMSLTTRNGGSMLALFASNDNNPTLGTTKQVDNCGARYFGPFFNATGLYSAVQLMPETAPSCPQQQQPTPSPPPLPTNTQQATAAVSSTAAIVGATTTTAAATPTSSGAETPSVTATSATLSVFISPDEPSPGLPLSEPVLIGIGAGGGCLLLLLVALCVWCLLRRKRRRADRDDPYRASAVMLQPSPRGNPGAYPQSPSMPKLHAHETKNLYDVVAEAEPEIKYESLPTNEQLAADRLEREQRYSNPGRQEIVYEPLH